MGYRVLASGTRLAGGAEDGNIHNTNQPTQPLAASPYATNAHSIVGPDETMRTHVLHIYHDGLHQRTKRVLSTDKETTLYTFEQNRKSGSNFTSTPHVRIYNGPLSTEQKKLQGVIDFYGSAISLELHGQPRIVMSTTGSMTTRAHEYKSVALPGRTLKWKKHGFWSRGDLICEDQHGEIVARLKRSGISVSKTGTFELGPLVEEGGDEAMIEIVAGGIALIELRKKQDLESRGDVEGGSGY